MERNTKAALKEKGQKSYLYLYWKYLHLYPGSAFKQNLNDLKC